MREVHLFSTKLHYRRIRLVAAYNGRTVGCVRGYRCRQTSSTDLQNLPRPVTMFRAVLRGDIGEFRPFGAAFVFEIFFGLAGEFCCDGLHQGFEVADGVFDLVEGLL